MKKILGILLGVGVGLVVLLVIVVRMQPAQFQVERSATIAAPPATVFGLVNNFHEWEKWSPWAALDPDMTTTFEGPEAGVGAVYSWSGNDQVGEGRMEITGSEPSERIVIDLAFLKPFAATNVTTFLFAPVGDGTEVTWRMEGTNNFIAKAFNLMMDMDAMIGADFEKGLAAMGEAATESSASVPEATE